MHFQIKHKYSFLLVTGCWLLATFSFAQDSLPERKTFLTFSAHYGFIMPHRSNMDYLIKSHIGAAEIDIIQATNGGKHWEKIYKRPEKGIGFYYCDLVNPILGDAIGIFPFVNFLLNPGGKFKLFIKAGDGLGIITNPYDRVNNHKNNINGSYINEFIYLKLNSVFYPTKNIRMDAGIALTHLSSGNWVVPNLGINILTASAGISFYKFKPCITHPAARDTATHLFSKKMFYSVYIAAGPNALKARNGPDYGAYTLAFYATKPVTEKSRFSAGFDAFYQLANLAMAEKDTSIFDPSNKLNNVQLGVRLGYELVVGKFALPYEMGYYVFNKTPDIGDFYHRLGLRYYVNKHFIVNYCLKSHWFVANNIEFGASYIF